VKLTVLFRNECYMRLEVLMSLPESLEPADQDA